MVYRLSLMIYRLWFIAYRLSFFVLHNRLSLMIYGLSLITSLFVVYHIIVYHNRYGLSFVVYRLWFVVCVLSFIVYHLLH